MEILVLNGSPRKGNTYDLLQAFIESAEQKHDITYFDLGEKKVAPCEACDYCLKTSECKHRDSTNEIIGQLQIADAIVFGTPVYWWGMTAQMKALIDKMYSFQSVGFKVPSKKIGLIIVGGAEPGNYQYKLITEQFTLISKFMDWEVSFVQEFSAYNIGDITKNKAAMEKVKDLILKMEQ